MIIKIAFALISLSSTAIASEAVVTTWNIEHLGSSGRGFGGGYGGGSIPLRTPDQLKDIATFIKYELGSDLLALQEIDVEVQDDKYDSAELKVIAQHLGDDWKYYIPPPTEYHHSKSMYVAYLWDSSTVRAKALLPMNLPNHDIALVNVHLASGQGNDENHLIAMTLIEWNFSRKLKEIGVVESERVILGDFNDNPSKKRPSGSPTYSQALYTHMAFKGYKDHLTPEMGSTRMDSNLQSAIDHVLINSSAEKHLYGQAELWKPQQEDMAEWRQTNSDHFPISFKVTISTDDDAD